MQITIEKALDTDKIDRFYDFYSAAFRPLKTLAAARHTLTPEEFAGEMRDERIAKYIAWDADAPVGLTTATSDLSSVPWIEPVFYQVRYPEHAAQGTMFYLGYILVDPDANTFRAFKAMTDTLFQHVAGMGGVIGFDVSAYNSTQAAGHFVDKLPEAFGARLKVVDSQRYYVAEFGATDA